MKGSICHLLQLSFHTSAALNTEHCTNLSSQSQPHIPVSVYDVRGVHCLKHLTHLLKRVDPHQEMHSVEIVSSFALGLIPPLFVFPICLSATDVAAFESSFSTCSIFHAFEIKTW